LCFAGGLQGRLLDKTALWPDVIAPRELSATWVHWFNQREGRGCGSRNSILRVYQLAQVVGDAINAEFGATVNFLDELRDEPGVRSLVIAEINFVSHLHQFPKKLPNLCYSEFASALPNVASEDVM
jgi:hypothetical protein